MELAGIGVAGCGRMGEPMLAALLGAGFDARGFDVVPASEFGALEAAMATYVSDFCTGLKVLISVVRDIPQTEQLLFNDQKVLANARDLKVVILSSTLSPRYVRDLRTRVPEHIALIDAPMSGARIAAQERRLSFMLGGEDATLDALQPLFAAMGSSFHRMGPFGAGMSAKVLNNLLAASSTVMTRLVLDWAVDQGLDERRLLDLIAASSGQNWFASGFESIEFSREGYEAENTMGILKKDVESALDAAPDNADTRLPDLLTHLIAELLPKPG